MKEIGDKPSNEISNNIFELPQKTTELTSDELRFAEKPKFLSWKEIPADSDEYQEVTFIKTLHSLQGWTFITGKDIIYYKFNCQKSHDNSPIQSAKLYFDDGFDPTTIQLYRLNLLLIKLSITYSIKKYLIVPPYHKSILNPAKGTAMLASPAEFFRDFPELLKYGNRYTEILKVAGTSIGYLKFNKLFEEDFNGLSKSQKLQLRGITYYRPGKYLLSKSHQPHLIGLEFLRDLMKDILKKRELEE